MKKNKHINTHKLRLMIFVVITFLALVSTIFIVFVMHPYSFDIPDEFLSINNLSIQSSVFKNNTKIPAKYTCDGDNISPQISITKIPENTESLAFIVSDPDASNGEFIHWIMWNINPKITEIKDGEVPLGAIQGKNDFGKNIYSGPCPPSGIHHYVFKIYALNSTLDLNINTDKEVIKQAISDKLISEASIVGLYGKLNQ